MNEELRIPPERDLPAGRLQRRREHLVSELAHTAWTNRRRKRRLVLILVPAVILLLAATGFTTYVLTREPTHLETIGCFDREGNTAVVNADGRHPVEICRELWQAGDLGADRPERLAACVLETGPVGVFPSSGPDTCERLGLADLPASYVAEARRFSALRDAVVARLVTDCVAEEPARTTVRRELDARGFSMWRIEVADDAAFTPDRPCASAAFDGERKVVVLVPIEPLQTACYTRPKLPTNFVLVAADGRDPVAVCTEAWREGRLGDADQPTTACLLHGSGVGVFPGSEDVCRSLGPAVAPLGNLR